MLAVIVKEEERKHILIGATSFKGTVNDATR